VLQNVYWSCMYGWLFRFFYGEELGNRLAAAEWYVQRQLIPRCSDDVGIVLNSITADITAHLVVEGPPEDLDKPEYVPGDEDQTQWPASSVQMGGSSSSSSGGAVMIHAEHPPPDVLEPIQEALDECVVSSVGSSLDVEIDYDTQRVLFLSQHVEMPQSLVHFILMSGECVYSMVLPLHTTVHYMEYVLNKQAFQWLLPRERWAIAATGNHVQSATIDGVETITGIPIARGHHSYPQMQLRDLHIQRTDDCQLFVTVVKVRLGPGYYMAGHWP